MLTHRGLKGTKEVIHEVYDFSKDGGAIGTINIFKLAAKSIVHDFWFEVETALTSGASATVEVGYAGGTANVAAQKAYSALTANLVSGPMDKGADLYDATNKDSLRKKYTSETTIGMKIATAALTGGKVHFYAEVSDGY
jgi:hypothetical protein